MIDLAADILEGLPSRTTSGDFVSIHALAELSVDTQAAPAELGGCSSPVARSARPPRPRAGRRRLPGRGSQLLGSGSKLIH